jgi:hypothetical protein
MKNQSSILDVEEEGLRRALRGDEPMDQTMVKEFAAQEEEMHERLLEEWGPDYASQSAGEEAIVAFNQRKVEAYSAYNRGMIRDFSEMAQERTDANREYKLNKRAFQLDQMRYELGERKVENNAAIASRKNQPERATIAIGGVDGGRPSWVS